MDLTTAKWIVLGALFVLTFIFSMLPLKLVSTFRHTIDPVKRSRYARAISLLSCFAGGVFMATGLLDLFPEVTDVLSNVLATLTVKTTFPVAEFTVAFGFFLVLITEQIVLDFKERSQGNLSTLDSLSSEELNAERRTMLRQASLDGISDHTHLDDDFDKEGELTEAHSALRSVLLVLALSLHSLFEGLAIGLQPTVQSLLEIFIAVILHKVIIAFSVGLNLVQSNLSLSAIIKSNFLFAITSPIGLGVGMGIEEFSNSLGTRIANGVLQGLACGTFVYVTFFEVLPHELNHGKDRLLKLVSILIGFSMVCGVLFLEPADPSQVCMP